MPCQPQRIAESEGRSAEHEVVGREHELRLLRGWLTAALEGKGRLVLCSGEPGIGKSRLAEELVRWAAERGIPAAWGRGLETARPPYWPWQQVLGQVSALLDPLTSVDDSGFVAEDLVPLMPELAARLGIKDGPEGRQAERRLRLFDSVSRFLRAAAARAGLVVVIDDLHWADPPSVLLLLHLVRRLDRDDTRLLLLAAYRHTEASPGSVLGDILPDLVGERAGERLDLRGLSEESVRAYLRAASRKEIAVRTARRVHDLTGGNPFFVGELGRELRQDTELGRELRQDEATRGSEQRWRVAVPLSVRGAIRRRLKPLSPACQELLRAASIVGPEFAVGVVAAMVGAPALVCLDLLDEASAAGIVEPVAPPGRYRFSHDLVRDAVEAELGSAARVRLHREAAEAIEAFYARQIEPHLFDIARHWAVAAAGGDGQRAATWASRAGDEAMRRLAYEEAARLYRLGLDVGARELDEATTCGLLLRLGRALHRSGKLGACLATCKEAAAVARRLGRPDLVGEAALVLEGIGEPRVNLAVRDLCHEALGGLGDEEPALRARLLAQLAEACLYLGDLERVEPASRDAVELAERSRDPEAQIAALRARHLARSVPEAAGERLALADRLAELSGVLASPEAAMLAHVWRIAAHFERGELSAVSAELPRLAHSVEQVRTPLARWQLLRSQATLGQAQGRFQEAEKFAAQALDVVHGLDHPFAERMHYNLMTAVGHHAGMHSDLADEIAAFPGDFGPLGRHLIRAIVLLDSGRFEEAIDEYRRLEPLASWVPPPFLRLVARATRVLVAVGIEEAADVAVLLEQLAPERGRHIAGAGGTTVYLGPVELYLGMAGRFLGRFNDAAADLEAAVTISDRSGARPFAVEAGYELARTLIERAGPSDLERARSQLDMCLTVATELGMRPFSKRSARLLEGIGGTPARAGLSAREREVAELVARGMTNREIAAALVVSERTAQNHVQHILTKLGFTRRSQIAAWVASRSR